MQYVVDAHGAEKYEGTEASANAIKAMCDLLMTDGTVIEIVSFTPSALRLAVVNEVMFGAEGGSIEVPTGQWVITSGYFVLGPMTDEAYAQRFRPLPDVE